MRFWIVLAAIVGIGAWCFKSCASKLTDRKPAPLVPVAGSAPAVKADENPQKETPAENPAKTPAIKAKVAAEVEAPTISRAYVFRHRNPPDVQSFNLAQTLGCTVTSDLVSRSVLMVGPADKIDMVADWVKSLDVAPGSCAVRAWVVFVERSVQKGWDLTAALSTVTGGDLVEVEVGNGAVTLNIDSAALEAALNVIADGSTVEVLQKPHLRLVDGEKARIETISEVPVPSTTVSQGISQTSVDYRKVGLQLNVQPRFLAGNRVRLTVEQINGMLGGSTEIEGNDVPTINSQTVSSSLEMSIGQAVILGGVTSYRKETRKGFLKDVEEITEGSLHVVICTESDAPRALPVGRLPSRESSSLLDALLPPRGVIPD